MAYFVYCYKLNKLLTIIHDMPNDDTDQNRLFLKIAMIMGASLGISQISYPSTWYFGNEVFLYIAGSFILIQQCVILFIFMSSKKVSQLCKDKICSTETSP